MRQGRFEQAHKGTLFLDEVGTMSVALQMKLLRALQEREFERIGDNQTIKVDVRVIAATNVELSRMVAAGTFREDLYYRLHVIPIELPPLRDRRDDIPLLVKHFLDKYASASPIHLSQSAMRALMAYQWPGNVRQLENAIFRAVVLADSETLGINEFPQLARSHKDEDGALPEMAGAPILAPQALELTTSTNSLSLLDGQDHVRTLDELERDVIRFAISHYRGQMSEVARRLQIGRSTLYRKLESLGLEAEAKEPAPVN
jgi:DNA-binding NtrC family response regulator